MGCALEPEDHTNSGFVAVVASGGSAIVSGSTLSSKRSGSDVNSVGDGYAYEVGVDGGNGFVAQSGILASTQVADLPASGTATMTGTYSAARITSISLSNGRLSGLANNGSGALTLVANFDNNTLIGSSTNQLLYVNGTFAGKALDGTVLYRGIPGVLTGRVGGDQAVGAFHGKTDTAIMAGGFMVDQ